MPTGVLTVALGLLGAAGVAQWVLAATVVRRQDEPGTTAFAAYAAVLGTAALLGALAGIRFSAMGASLVVFTVVLASTFPWVVFAFQYTGRGHWLTRRRLLALAGSLVLFYLPQLVVEGGLARSTAGVATLLYALGLTFATGIGLVQTTVEYGHLTPKLGVALGVAAVEPWFLLSVAFGVPMAKPQLFGLYALGFSLSAAALWLAVGRYGCFEATAAAAGTLGRTAAVEETDDPTVVVDDDERIVQLNRAARRELDGDGADPLGEPLSALLDDLDTLRDAPTVELTTTDGLRQFDCQVVALTDQHDRRLGSLVSLHDVTDQRLRRQRLTVLNRVLRHNLRNKLVVIKGAAEMLDERTDDDLPARIEAAADDLGDLGERAREVEQQLHHPSTDDRSVPVVESVETVVADVAGDHPDATVETSLPDAVGVAVDPGLFRLALSHLVENAIEHNDTDEPQVRVVVERDGEWVAVRVADDGPGIPRQERRVIESGEETELRHGSGVGLWAARWAVTRLGGDLGFERNYPCGSVVEIQLPASA